jgi:hypothetical protein
MKLFGQLVRTGINLVALPVTLPVAAVRDVTSGGTDGALKKLVQEIKRDADERTEDDE